MTGGRSYGSPGAFRRALTDKLRDLAARSRWTLQQLQRQMAYDRLLERLYLGDEGWIIKGATALLARDIGVRGTIDIDLYRDVAREIAEADLRQAAALDIGDWFRFEIGPPRPLAGTGGVRLPVKALVGNTEWAAFHVELAAAGYARKEGTRGAISTGGPQPGPAPSAGEPARKAPPRAAVPGRLTVWPVHTIPAHGSVGPDTDNGISALDVRAERPPADAAMALGITDPSRQVIVRRRLAAAPDGTPVQFRVSYIPAELAEGTPIAQSTAIADAWAAALTTYLGKQVRLASSQVTARHPNHEEAAALALPSDAAVLVREDIYEDRRGSPVDFTRTVWPGDTTRLVIGD